MEILIPIIVLLAIGALCALLLTVASAYFGVQGNEKMSEIRDCLPGANCGACGFSGCDGYAQALADGVTDKTNLCTPGGDGAAKDIAKVLGVEPQDVVEMVAYVACNGNCPDENKKFDYKGPKSCRMANKLYSGDRNCTYACLGYGDCVRVCPANAIKINERNVAEVDSRKCISCGLCARTCPNGIIHLVPDTTRVVVLCSSHDKGAAVRKVCLDGCIACGKCEKTCPTGAITVVDNLATIDYSKCISCGKCRQVCPTHCIHEGNFICGTHFI
ncbi:MAG: RnfABCDGE type electron transport complex subunit B [Clostridia bacterium]|nr:RnfABCDGE type electron transport complex subunit B [Clostridia bacterium]